MIEVSLTSLTWFVPTVLGDSLHKNPPPRSLARAVLFLTSLYLQESAFTNPIARGRKIFLVAIIHSLVY